MFDQKTIEAYQSIQPPSELKRRVLEQAPVKENPSLRVIYRTVGTIAACLALVLTLSVYLRQTPEIALSVNGETITAEQTVVAEAMQYGLRTAEASRMSDQTTIELMLYTEEPVSLTCDAGTLVCYETETQFGKIYDDLTALDGEIGVRWTVSAADVPMKLSIQTAKKTINYVLTFDAAMNSWTLRME